MFRKESKIVVRDGEVDILDFVSLFASEAEDFAEGLQEIKQRFNYKNDLLFLLALRRIGLNRLIRFYPAFNLPVWGVWNGKYWVPVSKTQIVELLYNALFDEAVYQEWVGVIKVKSSLPLVKRVVKTMLTFGYWNFWMKDWNSVYWYGNQRQSKEDKLVEVVYLIVQELQKRGIKATERAIQYLVCLSGLFKEANIRNKVLLAGEISKAMDRLAETADLDYSEMHVLTLARNNRDVLLEEEEKQQVITTVEKYGHMDFEELHSSLEKAWSEIMEKEKE